MTMTHDIVIRAAAVDEAAALTALCLRSKQHWGYDAAFMARAVAPLTVHAGTIAEGRVFVAGTPAGLLGMAELAPPDGDAIELEKLFVEPAAIGRRVGALLLLHAAAHVRGRGMRRMTILADPHAAAFYERMGARFLRMVPSDVVPGRALPFYELDLTTAMP